MLDHFISNHPFLVFNYNCSEIFRKPGERSDGKIFFLENIIALKTAILVQNDLADAALFNYAKCFIDPRIQTHVHVIVYD
jgi:hypothetical protein